ncbi:butyrophilin subfamily 1 member A1-like [Chanos chanos]|uniref:Butyrophilin subfamily 1 member A1-like n=1 Tax=Chanos chanos TaxID=29144 RepID=A0A6J2VKR6_CHACN|nr:butyrophilin subfamily 1 member A1-like [Chanos chanos]
MNLFLIPEQFQVVGPAGSLVAVAGEDLVLPCSLKPNISAVDMTVEWSRPHGSDTLVHLYTDHEDRNERQIESYRGRTALFKEELQKGNTSLKLSRVRVSDEGEYKCLIDNKSWQDDVTVEVIVEVVGTDPVITVTGCDDSGRLSLLCETSGWYPEEPDVLWLNSEGEILPAQDTETDEDIEGFNVKQRVIVQDSNINRLFCRVMMTDHMKEAEIFIPFCRNPVIRALNLIIPSGICLIMLIVLLYRKGQIQKAAVAFVEEKLSNQRVDMSNRELNDSDVEKLSVGLKNTKRTVEILR